MTTMSNSRKRRRVATQGLVLLACLGFALADSTLARGGKRLPPPPPPPLAKKKAETASTKKPVDSVQIQRNPQRPPPPRHFIDTKDQHQQQHQSKPAKRPPPPPRQNIVLDNPPIANAKEKLPPPPPPKQEMQLVDQSEENLDNIPKGRETEVGLKPQHAEFKLHSQTNSLDSLHITQQKEGKQQIGGKSEEEPVKEKADSFSAEKTSVEIMRLQDDELEEEKDHSASYSPIDKMTAKFDDTTQKEPLKPAATLSSIDGKSDGSERKDPGAKDQELSRQVGQSPLNPPGSAPSDPANYTPSMTRQMQNPRTQEYLPQQPSQIREVHRIPHGPQYAAPPRQQGHPGQPPAQYSRPPNQYRSPPQRYGMQPPPQRRSTATSTWKSLWGKVEKGLDGLANIEESISGRAQQLVSSVSSGSLLRQPPRQQMQGPKSPVDGRVAGQTSQGRKSMPSDQKVEQRRKDSATSVLLKYGQKFEMAKDGKSQIAQSKPSVTVRQIDWNDLTAGKKMIRANGGASAPHGQSPLPPTIPSSSVASNSLPPPPQRQPPSTQNASAAPRGSQTTNTSPFGANPYQQSSNMQAPAKKTAATHSRSSRIPWDTAVGSRPSAPLPNRATAPPVSYDDEDSSWKSRLSKLIPPIPRIPSPGKLFRFRKGNSYNYASMDAWKNEDDNEKGKGLFGLFRRGPKDGHASTQVSPNPSNRDTETWAPPLASMMARCNNGKTTSLLADSDQKQCRKIGRYQATFDIVCVMFLVRGMQQVAELSTLSLPTSLADLISTTVPLFASLLLRDSLETWAPFLFACAYLTMVTKKLLLEPKIFALASSVEATVEEESQYVQLYLRLVAGLPMDPKLPRKLGEAAVSQLTNLVSTSQLNAFVTTVLSLLVIMTVSVVRPVLMAILSSFTQLVFLGEWRSWPIAWKELGGIIKGISQSLYLSLESLIARGLANFLDNPMQFAFHLSIFGSLLITSLVPRLEEKRKIKLGDNDEDELTLSPLESAEQLSKLGTSSASRLSLLSENGSVENALERWRVAQASSIEGVSGVAFSKVIRLVGYAILTGIIAVAPIVMSFFVGESSINALSSTGLRWDSVLDVSVILFFSFLSVNNALKDTMASTETRRTVQGFLTALSKTLEEIHESNSRQADIQFMASVSPTAGLMVKDLWAAHTTKRAWAVRGANLHCKNGEILALLGDDGAGKTRMLTTIAEYLISPPKRSLTSNKVRGYIGVGGVEGSKWDIRLLKRRLGILLSDVRTVADTASLFSGWTMEEILEPVDGLRTIDSSHKLNSSEKSSIMSALKITGLYSTLIPKLPSKLATVITANEEDLRPSSLRPRCSVLSPAEWSKLILAKVIAQTIYDNDNAAASSDKVENSLIGSVLLLDEPTVLLSEVEEAKLLRELRQTGAATILTTNKWATGRFADHIAVLKDGAIVESGTHNELIARGPQQSLYAAKWHAMTMQ